MKKLIAALKPFLGSFSISNEKNNSVDLKRDWSKYGKDFISNIDSRDEMYRFLTQHPAIKDPEAEYFTSGCMMDKAIENIFESINYSFDGINSFLDFACGYGRFTRFLIQRLNRERIVVSDIDKNAVDFCVKTFGVRGFYSVSDPDMLEHKDGYDVIFVASLFSHLALPFWTAWFEQLYNMLNDEGLLILSTHGNYCFDLLDTGSKIRTKKVKEGFHYLEQSETSRLSTKEYGTTYVDRNFVENFALLKDPMATISFYPRGLWNFQDIYVIKR